MTGDVWFLLSPKPIPLEAARSIQQALVAIGLGECIILQDGISVARFDGEILSTPDGAVEMTDEQLAALIAAIQKREAA